MMDNLHHENVVVNTSIGIRFWRSEVSTRGYVPFHWHSSIELVCVLQGRLDFTINGQTFAIQKDQFIAIPSGVVHAVTNQPNTAYVLQIPLRVIEPYIDHPERVSFINNQVASPAYATALTLIKRLGTLLIKQPPAFRFDSQVAFVSLLKVLFTELRDPERRVANSDSVKQLLIFINDHSTELLSVAALAREFGYNPNYLSRRFKQQVGISLIHYIYLVKLNHLYNDLVNTDTDIRQLFQKNGLTNPRTARKFFREMFGKLPSEVRQQKSGTRPTEKQP